MVKVLRVENDEQKGMYAVYPKPDCIYAMQSASNHPTPEEDAALRDNWYKISRANTPPFRFNSHLYPISFRLMNQLFVVLVNLS